MVFNYQGCSGGVYNIIHFIYNRVHKALSTSQTHQIIELSYISGKDLACLHLAESFCEIHRLYLCFAGSAERVYVYV